jgi:uncharacterized membrane protein
MGPYYRQTSQGIGGFFDTFYQHPILIVLVVVFFVGMGVVLWKRIKTDDDSRL